MRFCNYSLTQPEPWAFFSDMWYRFTRPRIITAQREQWETHRANKTKGLATGVFGVWDFEITRFQNNHAAEHSRFHCFNKPLAKLCVIPKKYIYSLTMSAAVLKLTHNACNTVVSTLYDTLAIFNPGEYHTTWLPPTNSSSQGRPPPATGLA